MAHVRRFLHQLPSIAQIYDVGCGEGILVEEMRGKGYNIEGLDLNYEGEFVQRGDVTALPYAEFPPT